jgi:DNA polymerase III gamma/tau subunit
LQIGLLSYTKESLAAYAVKRKAPMLLTEKYRPSLIADFIGLDKPKKLCAKLAANPFDSGWLFVGASGTGKTTLALALATELDAMLHHIPSQGCTVEAVKTLRAKLAYCPTFGKKIHLVLIDEADQMTTQAQHAFLSMLDSTDRPQGVIFIFTCNDSERFEGRFLSRVLKVEFSSYGLAKDATELLARVWGHEANGADSPNFARIVKESNNNIRAALMELQKELIMA